MKGFEPSTTTMATWCSATELHPQGSRRSPLAAEITLRHVQRNRQAKTTRFQGNRLVEFGEPHVADAASVGSRCKLLRPRATEVDRGSERKRDTLLPALQTASDKAGISREVTPQTRHHLRANEDRTSCAEQHWAGACPTHLRTRPLPLLQPLLEVRIAVDFCLGGKLFLLQG